MWLLYQQTRLHLKLRERRVEALDQLKNQSEDIKKIETAIFSSGQRLGAVLKENHRLEIKMYSTFVYFFPWRFPSNIWDVNGLNRRFFQIVFHFLILLLLSFMLAQDSRRYVY